MGNCFSDPSKDKGQRLGSAPQSTSATPVQQNDAPPNRGRATSSGAPPQPLGGGQGGGSDPRSAAAAAAEARIQAANTKGVSKTNAKAGQLSAKLEAERRKSPVQNTDDNKRMMDPGQWN